MEPEPFGVLVVDDAPGAAEELAADLGAADLRVFPTSDPAQALEHARSHPVAVAVVDLVIPGTDGLAVATALREASPDIQVVILTGRGDLASAIEGIHHGIFDYMEKRTLGDGRLPRVVRAAAERWRLTRANRALVAELAESNRLLRELNEVGTWLTGQTHLDRLLEQTVAAARQLCGAEQARVMVFEPRFPEGRVVTQAAGQGAASIIGARLGPAEGVAALVAERREPVLLARAADHPRYSHRCDEFTGAAPGFLCVPLCHGSVEGALAVAGRAGAAFSEAERDVLASLARLAAAAADNAQQQERAANFFTHTSDILVSVLDHADAQLAGHSRAVATLADMLTRRLGLPESERRSIHFAALLHDIGKLKLPAHVLGGGSFGDEERQLMRRHPQLGTEILRPISAWADVLPMVHAHHERWDGKGYPLGKPGEDIPLGARVIAIADAFDVMRRGTPWMARRSTAEALAQLEAGAEVQFDPRLVRLFVAEFQKGGDPLASGA